MAKVQIKKGKFDRLQACSNEQGIIAAAAMDQRSSLRKSIEKAKGSAVSDDDLSEFKKRVTKVLTKYSSAILLDPEFGLPALSERAPGAGAILTYEKTGYDVTVKGRLPDLIPGWSVLRLVETGADAVKVLIYFNPFEGDEINQQKLAFIERIGSECKTLQIPLFLEAVVYDDNYDEKGLEFAKLKPKYVAWCMQELSKTRYEIDVLKVEIPINVVYLEGSKAFKGGEAAYDHKDALELFRSTAEKATKPFIYLSAGVDDDVFRESLELAAEAGVSFNGVLCGRATWKDGIPVFAKQGPDAMEAWLLDRGVKNIQALNETLAKGAKPWYDVYGGLNNIEVVD